MLAELAQAAVSFFCTFAVASTVAILSVLATQRWLSHAMADIAWKTAFVGPIVLAAVLTLLPTGALPMHYTLPDRAAIPLDGLASYGFTRNQEIANDYPAGGATVTSSPAPLEFDWPLIAFSLWGMVAVALLLFYARDWRRFLQRLRGRTAVDKDLATRLTAGLPDGTVRLSAAPGAQCPCAIGRKEIVLPTGLLEDDESPDLRGAVAHEAAHLRRHDPLWLVAWRTAECLFFFLPLLRVARRRHMETAEYLCDAWAIRHLGAPEELVRSLVVAARHAIGGEIRLAPGMAVRKRVLLDRVTRALDGSVHLPGRGRVIVATVAAVAMLGGIGMVTPVFSFMLQEQDVIRKPAKPVRAPKPPKAPKGRIKPVKAPHAVPAAPIDVEAAPLPPAEHPLPAIAPEAVMPVEPALPVEHTPIPEAEAIPAPVAHPLPPSHAAPALAPAVVAVGPMMSLEQAESILLGRTPALTVSRPKPPKAPRAERHQEMFIVTYRPLIQSILADNFENRTNEPADSGKKNEWSGTIHETFDDGSEYGVRFSHLSLTEDERAIRSIKAGGIFRIEIVIGRERHAIEIHPGDDGFRRLYLVDGQLRSFNAEARRAILTALDQIAAQK